MRFVRLDMVRFGPFTGASLEFSEPGVQLVYGDNEAGKSTLLRATEAALFGIPHRTQDDHLHPQNKLELGFTLEHAGERLELIRRKGTKNTLLASPGRQPVDEQRIGALTGHIGRETFLTLFGLDHHRLREGSDDLLRGKGELAGSLFGASLGTDRATELRDRHLAAARELYVPRGKKQLIPKLIREAREATAEANAAALAPDRYDKLEAEHDAALAAFDRAREQLEERRADQDRIERLTAARPVWEALERARADRRALGDVLRLGESEAEAAKAALGERTKLEDDAGRADAELDRLGARIAELEVSDALCERAARIADLVRERHACAELAANLPEQHSQRVDASARVSELAARLGIDDPRAVTRIPARIETELQTLTNSRTALDTERREIQRRLRDLAKRRARLEQALAALPEPRDPSAVRAARERLRDKGDVKAHAASARRRRDEVVAEYRRQRAALGLSGDAGDLAAEVPELGTIQEFAEAVRSAREVVDRHAMALGQIEERITDAAAELQALVVTGELPSEDALRAARARRDEAWRRLRPVVRGERPSASGDSEAADEVDAELARADQLADALRAESDRVARAAKVSETMEAARVRKQAEEAALVAARADLEDIERAWRARWSAAGVAPESPDAMRAWRERFERLLEQESEAARAERALEAAEEDAARHRDELAAALAAAHAPLAADADLRELGAAADELLAAESERRSEREELNRRLGDTRSELEEVENRDREWAEADREWTAAWNEAIAALPVPAQGGADVIAGILSDLGALQAAAQRERTLNAAIAGAEDRLARLEAHTAELCAELGRPPKPDTFAAIDELDRDCRAALDADKQREQLTEDLRRHTDRRDQIRAELGRAERALMELASKAGVGGAGALAAGLEPWARARALDERISELGHQLAQLCAPDDPEAASARLAGADPSALAARADSLRDDIARLERERDAALENKARLEAEIRALSEGSGAPARYQDAQEIRERLEGAVDDYLSSRLAGALVGRALEIYRERNQATVLTRAADIVRALTGGAIADLRADIGASDERELCAVRPGGAVVHVGQLSDGARDQLYLALRLAFVERHLESIGPLPLVLDDIFIHFDDRRTAAGLEVLGELSQRTQVLLFTHHRRLVELAAAAIPGELKIHELSAKPAPSPLVTAEPVGG